MHGQQMNCVHAFSRRSVSACPDCEIVERAALDLAEHFHFRRHLDGIKIDCNRGVVCIKGNLPTYYLKQLLQTVLREIPGVKQVNNQVAVVSSIGLSDSP